MHTVYSVVLHNLYVMVSGRRTVARHHVPVRRTVLSFAGCACVHCTHAFSIGAVGALISRHQGFKSRAAVATGVASGRDVSKTWHGAAGVVVKKHVCCSVLK